MVETTDKEQGNNIEQVNSIIDSLMGALIEAQKHFPPEKRVKGQEMVLHLRSEVKQIGYEQMLSGIDRRLREEVEMLQKRMLSVEVKMKSILSGAPNSVSLAHDALHEFASYKVKLPENLSNSRGIFHLSEARGLILAWQIENGQELPEVK